MYAIPLTMYLFGCDAMKITEKILAEPDLTAIAGKYYDLHLYECHKVIFPELEKRVQAISDAFEASGIDAHEIMDLLRFRPDTAYETDTEDHHDDLIGAFDDEAGAPYNWWILTQIHIEGIVIIDGDARWHVTMNPEGPIAEHKFLPPLFEVTRETEERADVTWVPSYEALLRRADLTGVSELDMAVHDFAGKAAYLIRQARMKRVREE
jgi:hypothetical protein